MSYFDKNTTYVIKHKNFAPNTVLDQTGSNRLSLHAFHGDTNQQFFIESNTDGTYSFKIARNYLYLGRDARAVDKQVWPGDNSRFMRKNESGNETNFTVQKVGENLYKIYSRTMRNKNHQYNYYYIYPYASYCNEHPELESKKQDTINKVTEIKAVQKLINKVIPTNFKLPSTQALPKSPIPKHAFSHQHNRAFNTCIKQIDEENQRVNTLFKKYENAKAEQMVDSLNTSPEDLVEANIDTDAGNQDKNTRIGYIVLGVLFLAIIGYLGYKMFKKK